MKKVLIISPHWPPINAPDMQRVRMSLPYYRAQGWEPVVLTVHPDDIAGTLEPELCETYPSDIRIIQCRALPLKIGRRVGLGNLGLRAWPSLLAAGTRLLSREKFDLVFFSTTQFITYTLGLLWKQGFGVPFVIDLQDPWRTDYYQRPGAPRPPGGNKYIVARILALLFERPTYRHASGFISVSGDYLSDLAQRYSWFKGKPQAVIRFGASEADLATARHLPLTHKNRATKPDTIHLLYTGAVGPIMNQSLHVLFRGFSLYRERFPQKAERFHFHFYGTSYVSRGNGTPSVTPVAEAYGLTAFIDEIAHRIGHLESISLQLQADALLILGSNDPAYSPSKLHPYYLTGKPILSVAYINSCLYSMLQELNCSAVACLGTEDSNAPACDIIERFLDHAINGFPQSGEPVRRDAYFRENFLSEHLTQLQCSLFNQVVKNDYSPPQSALQPQPEQLERNA